MKYKGKKPAELRSIISALTARATAKMSEIKDSMSDAEVRAIEQSHDAIVSDLEEAKRTLVISENELEERGNPAVDEAEITRRAEARAVELVKAEQDRRDTINDTARKLGLPDDFAKRHIEAKTSIEAFRAAAIEEKSTAERADSPTDGHNPEVTNPAVIRNGVKRDPLPGERAARLVRAVAGGKLLSMSPIEYARARLGDELTARTLAAGVAASGGYMVPEELAGEVIELLRPRTVFRSAGPRILSMPSGNISIARQNAGATVGYIGENAAPPVGDPNFGQVRLTAKKLAARVAISNDLLRFSSPSADAIVRDDLVRQMAIGEDQAFIRGAGTAFSPKGMRYWAPTGNLFPMTGSPNASTVIADLTKLVVGLQSNKVAMTKPTWFWSQRTLNYLMDIRDSVGGFLFRDELMRGTFRGYPFKWTQSIPENLGGGTESEVYLIDMDEALIAEVPGLILDASQEATYTPDGSTLVSAFDNDQTVIRCIMQHDFAMRHDVAVAVLTGVTWS
jgi:HK97 family phage major capsid protein